MYSCYKFFFLLLFSFFFPPSYLMSTGIAVDKNGLIYFVDGTTIRKVDQNGIISTFLGSNDLTSARPLTCDNSMDINQVTYTLKSQTVINPASVLTQSMSQRHLVPPPPPFFSPMTHHWYAVLYNIYLYICIYTYICIITQWMTIFFGNCFLS